MRKLLPALYQNHREGALPDDTEIVGVGREELSNDDYIGKVSIALSRFVPVSELDDSVCVTFLRRIRFVQVDALVASDYSRLASSLRSGRQSACIFYLATPSELFIPICGERPCVRAD